MLQCGITAGKYSIWHVQNSLLMKVETLGKSYIPELLPAWGKSSKTFALGRAIGFQFLAQKQTTCRQFLDYNAYSPRPN